MNRRVVVAEITYTFTKMDSARPNKNGPGSATNTESPGPNH